MRIVIGPCRTFGFGFSGDVSENRWCELIEVVQSVDQLGVGVFKAKARLLGCGLVFEDFFELGGFDPQCGRWSDDFDGGRRYPFVGMVGEGVEHEALAGVERRVVDDTEGVFFAIGCDDVVPNVSNRQTLW